MSEPILLAEWIAALKADLVEAVEWQNEREEAAASRGGKLSVPAFRLDEMKLEIEVSTTRETSGQGGVKFWIITGDAARKTGQDRTQKVTLTLKPVRDLHLGDDEGFLDPVA